MAFKIGVTLGDFPNGNPIENAAYCRLNIDNLVRIDQVQLHFHPELPPLYKSGLRYVYDTPGEENWFNIRAALQAGRGDCKVFTAWRVAELRKQGINAHAAFGWRWTRDPRTGVPKLMIHFWVKWPDGSTEDPSLLLGMPVGDVAEYCEMLRVPVAQFQNLQRARSAA